MKEFIAFLKTKLFWVNLVFAIIVFLFLIKFALRFTDYYSRHGEKIEVPNLYEMQEEDVSKTLRKVKLKYAIVDSTYRQGISPGAVVEQLPRAGAFVKRRREIKIIIAAVSPEKVQLTKTKDISLRQAVNMLQSKGLQIGRIKFSPSQFSNLVIHFQQNGKIIEENMLITKGTIVDIEVGKTNGYKVTVPGLRKKNADDAQSQLFFAGLNIGKMYFQKDVRTKDDKLKAVVYKQSQYPGNKIIPGTEISIWLSTTPELYLKPDTSYKDQLETIIE